MAALAFASILAGCGGLPKKGPALPADKMARAGAELDCGAPALPAAGSGRGGYYQDDGPGDNPPECLMHIPDAVPKIEPYTSRGNKPYVVFGKNYVPFTDDRPLKQRGRGSWYGRKFHGQTTSSGEPYDMYRMTAAHPIMPLPSYARVTNVANGRQVVVRINDRGPFHSGRIIDLSYTAALKLGYTSAGSAELEVERILPAEIERMAAAGPAPDAGTPAPPAASSAAPEAAPGPGQAAPEPVPVMAVAVSAMPVEMAPLPAAGAAAAPAAAPMPLAAAGALAEGLYLQLGAYSQAANAESARRKLIQNWAAGVPPLQVVQNDSLYRLYSGPFRSRQEADAAARQLNGNGIGQAIVVQR
ncbi:MAG: septal ring lytic transglycosylase RlpA family protein [Noviherbaspirillum sp.]